MSITELIQREPWPNWADKSHVDYTNGLTCNCRECVVLRGFFLCTLPFKDRPNMILHKREKESSPNCATVQDIFRARTESLPGE